MDANEQKQDTNRSRNRYARTVSTMKISQGRYVCSTCRFESAACICRLNNHLGHRASKTDRQHRRDCGRIAAITKVGGIRVGIEQHTWWRGRIGTIPCRKVDLVKVFGNSHGCLLFEVIRARGCVLPRNSHNTCKHCCRSHPPTCTLYYK
jgi:hypothetical protein